MFQDLKTMVEPATNQQTDEELSTNQTTDDELPTNQTTDDELPTNQHTEDGPYADLLTEKGGATSLQTGDGPTTCLSETNQSVSTDSSLPGIKVFWYNKIQSIFLLKVLKPVLHLWLVCLWIVHCFFVPLVFSNVYLGKKKYVDLILYTKINHFHT